jgi:hypothetical protein
VTLPTTTELLLRWDSTRPRSIQTEIGMSQLGSCRRQTGYMLGDYDYDEGFEKNGVQAVLGTAIHEVAAQAATMLIPGAIAEGLEVRFGGLLGHPDLWIDGIVRDVKTKGYTLQLENIRRAGPPQGERWQLHTYAAGLILAGYEVHTCQLDYIARDSGDTYLFEEPFSVDVVAEAMAWLEQVRTAEVVTLPRDYRPGSGHCQSCPWFERCWETPRGSDSRAVLFADDPDAAAWAMQLDSARAMRKLAEERIADAQGALDALRSVSRPGESEDIEVPGLDKLIRFRVNKPKTSPDMATIAVDYARAGARPPFKVGEPVVNVTLVKRKEEQ